MTNAQLQAQLTALQAQLTDAVARAEDAEAASAAAEAAADAARAEAAALAAGGGGIAEPGPVVATKGRRRRGAGWAVLSVACIVVAAVLAPVALVASWAGSVLTDTDRFVATYAPLIDDPAVQDFVVAQTTGAITGAVDIDALVGSAFDGISDAVGMPPAAKNALGMLQGAAVEAIVALLDQTVRSVVTSDTFSSVWEQALRTSHTQLVASLSGDPAALVQLQDDGVVGVQIGPLVAQVREQLQADGIGIASLIPDIDATIVIVQSDSLPAVRAAYGIAVGASVALPILCLVLLAAGVLAARRRSFALVGAALGLAIPMGIVALAIAGVGGAIGLIVPVSLVPESVSSLLFWTVAGPMRDVAIALVVLAVAVAVIAWFSGSSRVAVRLRDAIDGAFATVRAYGAVHGLSTGRFGTVLHEQRWLVRAAIAVVAGAVIILVRPITVGLVIGTVAVAILVLLVAELLRRPPVEVAELEAIEAELAAESAAGPALGDATAEPALGDATAEPALGDVAATESAPAGPSDREPAAS